MTTIALIGDHKIFCDSLTGLINDFDGFKVIWCVQDGRKAIELLQDDSNLPDIILLDIVTFNLLTEFTHRNMTDLAIQLRHSKTSSLHV